MTGNTKARFILILALATVFGNGVFAQTGDRMDELQALEHRVSGLERKLKEVSSLVAKEAKETLEFYREAERVMRESSLSIESLKQRTSRLERNQAFAKQLELRVNHLEAAVSELERRGIIAGEGKTDTRPPVRRESNGRQTREQTVVDDLKLRVDMLEAKMSGEHWLPQEYSKRPEWILERTFQKYSDLERNLRSIVVKAKLSAKGGGQNVDAAIELYADEIYAGQPRRLYLDISEDKLKARVIVAEGQVTAVIIVPNEKVFASVSLPKELIEKLSKKTPERFTQGMQGIQRSTTRSDIANALGELQRFVIMLYDGMQDTRIGIVHKIVIKPRDSSQRLFGAVYILDGTWDPVRLEVSEPTSGSLVIEFEKLELNVDIPDEKFVVDTGYYLYDPNLMTTMMSVISAMIEQNR